MSLCHYMPHCLTIQVLQHYVVLTSANGVVWVLVAISIETWDSLAYLWKVPPLPLFSCCIRKTAGVEESESVCLVDVYCTFVVLSSTCTLHKIGDDPYFMEKALECFFVFLKYFMLETVSRADFKYVCIVLIGSQLRDIFRLPPVSWCGLFAHRIKVFCIIQIQMAL